MAKRHPNENLRTQFEGSGRFAGTGINEDDYSEESFPDERKYWRRGVAFWHKPIKYKSGEVKTYKLTDEELEYYRSLEVKDAPDKPETEGDSEITKKA